ncbi:MAG: DEAD/DEAH box helicase [Aureispira sp.]|nr:DEAD/DEAH box helicase [Aureispira sp.]
MPNIIKNQKAILAKLGIQKLNDMQDEAHLAIQSFPNVVLLSPTGTGKTLAFLLPVIAELDPACKEVQAMIIAPSRELAIQIEQVARNMGTGYKINAFYGGRAFSKDRMDLNNRPAILVGTPGRVADHLRKKTFTTDDVKVLVLDEFDKSLEIGFDDDMEDIIHHIPTDIKKILTSATQEVKVPKFVDFKKPVEVNYLGEGESKLTLKAIISPEKDKLNTLLHSLAHIGNQPGIIFCNFRNSIERVSDFLHDNNIDHGCFHGGMEQQDRERALIKFRNGTQQIIVATDLAARGIDIPEIKFIIHYHLPVKEHEFTHRNGRTARMHNNGTAYVLQWKEEPLPDFIKDPAIEELHVASLPSPTKWDTLFISGGRKDKISKGDIAGTFMKKGGLNKDELGLIEIKQDCAFVAVAKSKTKHLIDSFNNSRIKKRKVRIYSI